MIQNCSLTLINNTITQNRCTNTTTSAKGGGLLVYNNLGSFNGVNNIVHDNYATTNPEIFGTVNFNYSCSSVQLSGTGNYMGNPQFVSPTTDDFHLLATSPCVDTGDPASPLDPDGSRADMGALYYPHTGGTTLTVIMTPINPPIQIPANGGSFQFICTVQRTLPPQSPFFGWARIREPGGIASTVLGPVQINPPVGISVSRQRTQMVPSSWIAGLYWYIGYVNPTVSYPTVDADSFQWTKLATGDGGPMIWEAANYGEEFPYQVGADEAVAHEFALIGAAPNPFNPATTISFTLPEASQVMLSVFDVNGRQVATLVNGHREAGPHQVTFDGSALASGMYIYTLTAGSHSATGKMMLVK
jgi:hypothetical protein